MCLRILLLTTILFAEPLFGDDLLCATWNMKWFPSGRADVRRDNFIEETITADNASKIIRDAYQCFAVSNKIDIVFFVQEIRDRNWCVKLVEKSGIPELHMAAVSDFRDNAGIAIWQQTAILSTLTVVESGFDCWKSDEVVDLPRGFSYAILQENKEEMIACFCIHLKSNHNSLNSMIEEQRNIYKREVCAPQILSKLKELQSKYGRFLTKVLVAGDFNTNEDDHKFVSESTLRSFYGAHFRNCFARVKKADRITYPSSGAFPDATFDYVLFRGFDQLVERKIFPGALVSDHNLVMIRLR